MLNNFKNTTTISERRKFSILLVLPISLIILSLLYDTPINIIHGIYQIIIHPDILVVDYIKIGGLSATFMNSGLLTLINIFLLKKFKVSINGLSIAAIFISTGFGFFGKNILNIWPTFIGVFLYAKYQKINLKSVLIVSIFGTSLSPLINELTYTLPFSIPVNIILAVSVSIFAGFILPPLSSHFMRTHDGYSLYNVGFTTGFVGTIIMSIMRSYGFISKSQYIISTDHNTILKFIFTSFFIILIIIGYYLNNKSFKGYKNLLSYSGRAITDFTHLTGFGFTLINMGFMGLIGLLYVIISGNLLNGPIVGALLTLVGFSAFGNHPKNSIPIMVGVYFASLTHFGDIDATILIISGLFSTTLAPIAGQYGSLYGIIAGFLHLAVVKNIGSLHGGINLYNNGFSGGIVASVLVPIIDSFKKGD